MKKTFKALSFLILLTLMLTVCIYGVSIEGVEGEDGVIDDPSALFSGLGTEASPYIIAGKSDLAELALLVAEQNEDYISAYYSLTSDIDFNGVEFTPIGTKEAPFMGTFLGNGHSIENMTITTAYDTVGFFGAVRNASIKDLLFKNANINIGVATTNTIYAGVVVGYASFDALDKTSYISGCSVSGNVSVRNTKGAAIASGIIAETEVYDGTQIIENCRVNAKIKTVARGNVYSAGVVGVARAAVSGAGYQGTGFVSISNCVVSGMVSGESTINNYLFLAGIVANLEQQQQGWWEAASTASLMSTSTNVDNCVVACEFYALSTDSGRAGSIIGRSGTKFNVIGTNYVSESMALDSTIYGNNGTLLKDEDIFSKEFYMNTLGYDFENMWCFDFDLPDIINKKPYIAHRLITENDGTYISIQAIGCDAATIYVIELDQSGRIQKVSFLDNSVSGKYKLTDADTKYVRFISLDELLRPVCSKLVVYI